MFSRTMPNFLLGKCAYIIAPSSRSLKRSSLKRFFSTSQRRWYREASYFHEIGEQPLFYKTIGTCLDEAANKWPDRAWVKDLQGMENITFSQALQQADSLAAGFLQLGMQPGDMVGVCSPNCARWFIVMMAAARAGLVMVAINPAYRNKELEYSLKKVGVKLLVTPSSSRYQNYYEMLLGLIPELNTSNPRELNLKEFPNLKGIIMIDDVKMPGTMTYKEVISMSSPSMVQAISELQLTIKPDDGCNIQFTSGTTGNPKAAFLSHFNYVNNSFVIGKRSNLPNKHHILCTQVPLFHAFGLIFVIMASLQHGATCVLPSAWYNPIENLKAIVSERCTLLPGTPTMHVDLVAKQREMKAQIDSLDLAVSGGASCTPQLFNHIKNVLGVKNVKSIFGMTETTAVSFQSLDNETMEKVTQTVGRVQEHVEVQVVDTNGKVVPFGTPGELCVRGYCNMLGYFGDYDKTREIIGPDNWLKTGDQFVLHEDGYGKVVGRLKDMINRGGENVFPKEIEDFLTAHPDILECHVFGVNDDRLGEEICVGIKLREGSNFDQKTMENFCKGNIAPFKVPRYLKIMDSFPKTGSGKIQKFKLKEMVESGKI